MSKSVHGLIALTLLGSVLYGGYWAVERFWFGTYAYYTDNIEQTQDRLQRFNSMLAARPELEQKIQLVRQDHAIQDFYLAETTPTLAATGLQQRARRAIESNGGSLVSTQILPVTNEDDFSRVAIRVQMTGDTDAVQKMLYALEAGQPLVFIENVQVRARTIRQRARRQARTNQRNRRRNRAATPVKTHVQLTTQFELTGYMPKRDA